jgi:hypothetical protein
MNNYIHSTPGRLRLKIPSLKRNYSKIEDISLLLREKTGVEFFEVSHLTGSVTIKFDKSLTNADELLRIFSDEGIVDPGKLMPSHQYMDKMFSKAGESASRALISLAFDKAFEGSSLSMLAAFI